METLEKRKSISSIKDEGLGRLDKPDYITVKGTVNYIKHDTEPYYTACPTPNCNKKVTENNGRYSCEKCNKVFDNVSDPNIAYFRIS
jgi:replication factor A1